MSKPNLSIYLGPRGNGCMVLDHFHAARRILMLTLIYYVIGNATITISAVSNVPKPCLSSVQYTMSLSPSCLPLKKASLSYV